ncbi:MAG: pseudouridine synthase [Verrucomicrobiae bacterium]|nr:pseudouridine synthase [Verrucomicrobiae bacterium]
MLIAFNKPYGVVSQFTREHPSHRTLGEFGFPPGVYPVGRLDLDSEGLLLLTNEPELHEILLNPKLGHPREYLVQVERIPSEEALAKLAAGVTIGDHHTLPAKVKLLDSPPPVPPRNPPIRFRKTVPDCWLSIELKEGKNRQVRRMTAAVGHPTLRLIRIRIGQFNLNSLPSGKWKILSPEERRLALSR